MSPKSRSTRTAKAPVKYKQQSLLSRFSSPPRPSGRKNSKKPAKTGKSRTKLVNDSDEDSDEQSHDSPIRAKVQRRIRNVAEPEDDSDSSDVGKIKFEASSSSAQSNESSSDVENMSPKRPMKRRRILIFDTEESDDEADRLPKGGSKRIRKRNPKEQNDSDSDVDASRSGKTRLLKGRKPTSDEEDDIMDGIDENQIIDDRRRIKPTKKSIFMENLEKLKRKKRGLATSDSEDEASEGNDTIPGARCDNANDEDEDETSLSDTGRASEEDIDSWIVNDEGETQTAALPAMFSMTIHQDLIHQFKIVCQYLVHLAVTTPAARQRIAERLRNDEYFSIPLSVTKRKLSDIRDSIVSSVWRPRFKKALMTYPKFELHHLDFTVPHCDACNLGGRLSTLEGRLGEDPYDRTTFQAVTEHSSDESDEESERGAPTFNLGRFCAQRTGIFHQLCHWEYELFRELLREVEELVHIGHGFVKIASASTGDSPPEDVSDADQVMEWLDQRGIITAEWLKVKQLMSRATNLEADVKRGREDD